MKSAYPYQTIFGDITVDVLSVSVDDADLPYSCISRSEQTVALHSAGREQWEQATLHLDANLPEKEVAEGPWSEVTCIAILSEKATNARIATRLTHTGDGHWSGSIELARPLFHTRALLNLMVVGMVDGVPGRVVGAVKQPWYVDLMATVPVRQSTVRIHEIDFRNGELEWLHAYADSPWIVETTGEQPTVHLNTAAVEGLTEVLRGKGGSDAERTLREMTASQIAQDTWIALFHAAASGLETDEDGTPVMPGGWRESVLRMMLPDVLPGNSMGDALLEINKRRQGAGWAELQTNIQYAASKRSRIARKLTAAMRAIDRGEHEDV